MGEDFLALPSALRLSDDYFNHRPNILMWFVSGVSNIGVSSPMHPSPSLPPSLPPTVPVVPVAAPTTTTSTTIPSPTTPVNYTTTFGTDTLTMTPTIIVTDNTTSQSAIYNLVKPDLYGTLGTNTYYFGLTKAFFVPSTADIEWIIDANVTAADITAARKYIIAGEYYQASIVADFGLFLDYVEMHSQNVKEGSKTIEDELADYSTTIGKYQKDFVSALRAFDFDEASELLDEMRNVVSSLSTSLKNWSGLRDDIVKWEEGGLVGADLRTNAGAKKVETKMKVLFAGEKINWKSRITRIRTKFTDCALELDRWRDTVYKHYLPKLILFAPLEHAKVTDTLADLQRALKGITTTGMRAIESHATPTFDILENMETKWRRRTEDIIAKTIKLIKEDTDLSINTQSKQKDKKKP